MSTEQPIIIERIYHAPIDIVWQALTDREEMQAWYFKLAAFEPVVGFEFSFEGGPDDRKYLHLCRVTEVIPHKKISYTWRYDGYEGISEVSFELSEQPNEQTRVVLTHTGLESFPASNPDFAKENFIQGWTHILGTSLKDYVEKRNS